MSARGLLAVVVATALVAAGCGKDKSSSSQSGSTSASSGPATTRPVPPGKVEEVGGINGGFDPRGIYRRESPGVVTVISVIGSDQGQRGSRGVGSGFVIDGKGEIATNAHVVTEGQGPNLRRAKAVYVKFSDGNEVSAEIVGADPDSDVALLKVNPSGLTLRPLPLGTSSNLVVGSPVAAIGSPFNEPESLSVGVISATGRTIPALTGFSISDAIQTDAAINRGNSGGPLIDGGGRVIGINSQIESTGGGGEGVGFAVPVDTVKRSISELRAHGQLRYAYIGISSVALYPQLARHVGLPVDRGAYVQEAVPGGPAAKAGLRGGSRTKTFQAQILRIGGDAITKLAGQAINEETDLGRAVEAHKPGDRVEVEYWRDGRRRTTTVTLGTRPGQAPPDQRP